MSDQARAEDNSAAIVAQVFQEYSSAVDAAASGDQDAKEYLAVQAVKQSAGRGNPEEISRQVHKQLDEMSNVVQLPTTSEDRKTNLPDTVERSAQGLKNPEMFAHDVAALNQALGWVMPIDFDRFIPELDEAILADDISTDERRKLRRIRQVATFARKFKTKCSGLVRK